MLLLNEREHLETLELLGRKPETVDEARRTGNTTALRFPWGPQCFYIWEPKAPLIVLARD